MVRAEAKVNGDANLPHAKSVAVKRFNLSFQLLVPQHEAMEPSVTEESLATKLCEVFEFPRGDSVWAGHLYQLHPTIIFFFRP